jgi:hypothetical protein
MTTLASGNVSSSACFTARLARAIDNSSWAVIVTVATSLPLGEIRSEADEDTLLHQPV